MTTLYIDRKDILFARPFLHMIMRNEDDMFDVIDWAMDGFGGSRQRDLTWNAQGIADPPKGGGGAKTPQDAKIDPNAEAVRHV